MSKDLVHPSLVRAGYVELEMADETADVVNLTIASNQAHLQGEPFYVDSLPEDMNRMRLADTSGKMEVAEDDEDDCSSEDEFYLPKGQDPLVPFQGFLEEVGARIVKRMKSGEGFFKIWSTMTEDIKGYVLTNVMKTSSKTVENRQTQTDKQLSSNLPQEPTPPKREEALNPKKAEERPKPSKAPEVSWTNETEEVNDIEGEVAHQVAESFSKKYKFPSRSSGIFLWNFEQLKMNLDDIVKASMNIPGVEKIAEKGGKLPLRCILGFVALDSSKRFRLLADTDKVARLMQDDINSYMARLEDVDRN
uniref:Phosphoprotein n=1 Tax=Lagos bat virus TaxID=38766 RepID=B3SN90_LBV|nr:phosphoprotein [Lyssavirus lagos]